jgi:hypothetical protein
MTVLNLKNFAITLLCLFCTSLQASSTFKIDPLWSIENTFKLPESAAYDAKRDKIYVSNIVKYAKDGSGFISRVKGDGNNLEFKWITGLNSPTGLTVYQDILYAVDMDVLVVIDLIKGKVTKRINAPVSEKPPLLNDVTVSTEGDVYVSGRASRKLYKLENEKLIIFVDDDIRLKKANGLLVDGDELIHGGQFWNRFSRKNAQLIKNSAKPAPSPTLFDFDGITHDGDGGYFVTVIDDPRLWHIGKDGKTRPLSEEKIQGIDLHFDVESNRLFVPRVGGGLTVYCVTPVLLGSDQANHLNNQ